MELYQLRYFQAVAERQNMSKAAEDLHVSQPALSRSIKKLEDELGVELLDRVGKRVVLNENGAVLLDSVNNVLAAVDSVGSALQRHVRQKNQTLNLRGPVSFGDDEGVIAGFKKLHPEIYVRYAQVHSSYFDAETADLSFFASFLNHREPNYLKLCSEDIVVAVRPDHPLAKAKSVKLASLASEQFVFALPSAIRQVIDGMFVEAGYKPQVVLEDQHSQMLWKYVVHGLGIALVPAITWVPADAREQLKFIPISDIKRTRHLYLKWDADEPLTTAAVLFRDYLANYYENLSADLKEQGIL